LAALGAKNVNVVVDRCILCAKKCSPKQSAQVTRIHVIWASLYQFVDFLELILSGIRWT